MSMDAAAAALNKFQKSIKTVAPALSGFAKIKANTAKALGKTFAGFKKAGGGIKAMGGGLMGVISQFLDFGSILKVLEPIFAPINALLGMFAGTLGQTIQPVIQEFFDVLMDPQIIEIITLLGEIIGQALIAAIRIVIAVIRKLQEMGVFDFLIEVLTAVVEGVTWFAENLDVVWQWIVDGFNTVVGFFQEIGEFFIGIWEWIVNAFNAVVEFFKPVADFFVAAWEAVVQFFQDVADIFIGIWNGTITVWEAIVMAFEAVINFFIAIWEGVLAFFSGVVDFFEMIWNAIVTGFFAFVNFFIGIINGIIDLLNALDFLDVFEDIPHVQTLALPQAQEGGFVKQGGAVIVHPNERILTAAETAGLGGPDNSKTITVNIEATVLDDENAEKLAREVERAMIRVMS
ncbi:MAG: phage tail protein [Planctomycetota bacterium]|jgi:phage-related protein